MSSLALKPDEQHRHDAEIAYWWKVTKGKPAAIKEVPERIEGKRGKAGAERVRAGLMEIWRGAGK